MAVHRWNGGTATDWAVAGNWSGGVPIAAGDVEIWDVPPGVIIANVPAATAGLNYASLKIGPQVFGQIGSEALPLYLGSVTAPLIVDGVHATALYLAVDTGDTCVLDLRSAGSDPHAVMLQGAGTWSAIRARQAGMLRLGTCNVTVLETLSAAVAVLIESGAVVAGINMSEGVVNSYAGLTGTLTGHGGAFNWLAATALTIATYQGWGRHEFKFFSAGGTITNAYLRGGAVINGDGGPGIGRTITNLYRYLGSSLITGRGAGVAVTNDFDYGGLIVSGAAS